MKNWKTNLWTAVIVALFFGLYYGYEHYTEKYGSPDGVNFHYIAQSKGQPPVVGLITFVKWSGEESSTHGERPTYVDYSIALVDFETGKLIEKKRLYNYRGTTRHFIWGSTEEDGQVYAVDFATGKNVFPISKLGEIWPDCKGWLNFSHTEDQFIFQMEDGREIKHNEADLASLALSEKRPNQLLEMNVSYEKPNGQRRVVIAWQKERYITTKKDYLMPRLINGNDSGFLMTERISLANEESGYVWINADGTEGWNWNTEELRKGRSTVNWNLQKGNETVVASYDARATYLQRIWPERNMILWCTEF